MRYRRILTCTLFIPLALSSIPMLAQHSVAYAESSRTDSVHFCAPFDYEQWRRDNPRPAAKQLAVLNTGAPRTVRMIYFSPNDRPYRAALADSLKTKMRQMHTFFANQMSAHGYGSEGFRFEKDAAGQPKVHRVNGQHPTSHYLENDTADAVLNDIGSTFDIESNVYFIVIDTNGRSIRSGDRFVGGVGAGGKRAGFALVPSKSKYDTDAHELGHAFGLNHDFRNNSYVMSYESLPDWLFGSAQLLSACNADFLAVHAYFNRQIPTDAGTLHTIEELTSSPIHTADRTSIPIRIKVRDPDGLSRSMLYVRTLPPHSAEGSLEVKDCRGFDGQTDHTFEFDYDGVVPSQPESDFYSFRKQSLIVKALDALGNVGFSRRFELINNEYRRPITDFLDKRGRISSMNFSPGGNLYAFQVSYQNNKLDNKVLNVSTGRNIASFPPRLLNEIIAFSADNKRIALESDEKNIEVWDIRDRRRLVTIDAQHRRDTRFKEAPTVSSLVFSPDGKLLASGGRWDYKIELWNALTGEHVTTYSTTNRGSILALVFSDDGKFLAALKDGTIEVWNVVSKEPSRSIRAHRRGHWNSLSFSPDGKLLASGGFRESSFETDVIYSEIKLWDTATDSLFATLSGRGPVVFSPDGKFLASASASETKWFHSDGVEGGDSQITGGSSVKLWDVATKEPIISFPPIGKERVERLEFSSDMRLLAESSDNRIRLWDLSEWTGIEPVTSTADEDLVGMFDFFKKLSENS